MKKLSTLHKAWMKDAAYHKEYDVLGEEFALASALIEARARAGLTQEHLAARMKTTQNTIASLESGKALPSARTLQRIAEATGSKLKIVFEAGTKASRRKAA